MRALILRRSVVTAATALLLSSSSFADDQVRMVQEALKEQQFFFGDVTGTRDEETRAAVRRFQIHSGLPVSGEIDAATIAAIKTLAAPEATTTEPEQEVGAERSVRGRMREVVRSDEEFLQEVEAPEESTAIPGLNEKAPATAVPPLQPERTPQVEPPPRPEPTRESSIPPPPPVETERTTTVDRPPEPNRTTERPSPARARSMTEEEAERFVQGYLNAAEAPTPEREISHYADRVDYFDSGRVNLRFVEKDQKNYYRRWPERNFDLMEADLVKSSENSATVRFRTKYALRGKKERASGKIENVVRLTRGEDGDWKIASIRERKLAN